jgi:NAD(P)-dependent dehydrogenase (short-subunit alcohol dehydrogenase family)
MGHARTLRNWEVVPLPCRPMLPDHEAVERAVEMIEREFGAIDIWINNAMVSVFSPVKEMKPLRVGVSRHSVVVRLLFREACGSRFRGLVEV